MELPATKSNCITHYGQKKYTLNGNWTNKKEEIMDREKVEEERRRGKEEREERRKRRENT